MTFFATGATKSVPPTIANTIKLWMFARWLRLLADLMFTEIAILEHVLRMLRALLLYYMWQ